MLTLAHFLIHTFMMIHELNVPPLIEPAIDIGPFGSVADAQALSHMDYYSRLPNYAIAGIQRADMFPLHNTASFAWYSTHLFWAIHCERGFEAPTEADNIAPYTGANSILYRA